MPNQDILKAPENQVAAKCLLLDHLNLIPNFSGQDKSFSVQDFLSKLDSMAQYLSWSEQDKVFVIQNRVTGVAAEVVKNALLENSSFANVEKALKSRFGVVIDPGQALQKFLSFQQTACMPVTEFISKAKVLAQSIVSVEGLDKTIVDLNREKLLRSMLLSNLRPEIRRGVIARNPSTVEQLTEFALLEEKGWNACRSQPSQGLPDEQVCVAASQDNNFKKLLESNDTLTAMCSGLADKVQELSQEIESLKRNQTQISDKCWSCGRTGHIARNCSQRQNRQSSQNGNRRGQYVHRAMLGNRRGNRGNYSGRFFANQNQFGNGTNNRENLN